MKDKLQQYIYYILIGVISLIAVFFFPMLGSTIGIGWSVPDTVVGWIVYVVTRILVSIVNVLLFHCFMLQAKLNIKDNERYKQANDILDNIKKKEVQPRSPRKWQAQQYGRKGTFIFLGTAFSTVALTQAILTFDWVSMLTYFFAILFGVIFGVLQMKSAEDYWTNEYYQFAMNYKLNNNDKGANKND